MNQTLTGQNRRRLNNLNRRYIKKTGDNIYLYSGTAQVRLLNWMLAGYDNQTILKLMIWKYRYMQTEEFKKKFAEFMYDLNEQMYEKGEKQCI